MRTSKISQDTTRMFDALSPTKNLSSSRRATRSGAKGLATYSLGWDGTVEIKEEGNAENEENVENIQEQRSPVIADIEDVVGDGDVSRSSRKRKLATDVVSPTTHKLASAAVPTRVVNARTSRTKDRAAARTVTTTSTEHSGTLTSSRKKRSATKNENENEHEVKKERGNLLTKSEETDFAEHDKNENGDEDDVSPDRTGRERVKAKPKIPARRTTSPNGTVTIHPPSNWAEIYDIISTMRRRNPVAPVDTMGCEDLFWQTAPPAEKRYHTLTALMLSSQTKDTITAAAMQRLHTGLVPGASSSSASDPALTHGNRKRKTEQEVEEEQSEEQDSKHGKMERSTLTITNMIAASPSHLNSLIAKVGFHNVKTKNLQLVAAILKTRFDGDIPSTPELLMTLPGVGPKMAYLCMSAAWGVDVGIGVDVHVHRITNLWGWHTTRTPEETRLWLEGWLPRDKWHGINKMLVGLGQLVCLPVGRRCGECDLAGTGLCKGEIRGQTNTKTKRKVTTVKSVVKREGGDDEDERRRDVKGEKKTLKQVKNVEHVKTEVGSGNEAEKEADTSVETEPEP